MTQPTCITEPAPPQTAVTSSLRRAAVVAFGFAIFFLLLRTQQYLVVDGALRSLAVFHNPSNRLHGNNHMLYPFWIWLWTRAAALAGWQARDWLAFVRQCQAMNAVCGALGIGMLFSVLETIAGTRYALLGSLQFGLSTAVLLHATNSAEPVTGLFFSLCALAALLRALRAESRIGLFLVGLLLALAMASYQSSILVMPMVAFACICWPGTSWRTAAARLAGAGAGGLLGVVTIYGLAYSSLGVPPRRMFARFLLVDGGQVYGGFSVSKLVNVPFGLIRNLFHAVPSNYAGIRWLLKDSHAAFWISADVASFVLLAALGCLIAAGVISAVRRSSIPKPLAWAGIAVSALALAFPLFYWNPMYDKLWLQPLAVLTIAGAFAFQFGALSALRRKMLTAGLVAVLIVEAAVNIPRTIQDHVHPTADLEEARDFAGMVKPGDSVVVDFDDVSMLWTTIWGYDVNDIVLPATLKPDAADWLVKAEKKGAGNGSLFFVGVLDEDRRQWDAFLGRATGISYAEFDCYRQKAAIVRTYPLPTGQVTVRQLQPASACEGLAETAEHQP
jgi:hypothetical protein